MDETTDIHDSEDAAVILVENEAESLPVKEKSSNSVMHPSTLQSLDACPVCHLNVHSREPKLLPCLHSFCKKCLPPPSRNLAMPDPTGNTQVDSVTKPLNVIRCPVCRQECMEVDVMDNFFVKDSVEAPSSTVERTVQLCMSCDDNTEATGFCVDCAEFLCVTCVEAHQRVRFTKDHAIRQKEEVAEDSVSTPRQVFCDLHKQEPLKLFCETCDLLTCRDCQLLKHKDHNYQFLEEAFKNHKRHMESLTCQLQEKQRLIEEVSNSINNGLSQVDENRISVHNEIKKSICSLILDINMKGKILVSQLEALTKDHETVLKKQQEDIGYLSRHLDHVINFTKWATARNGGTALLFCKRLVQPSNHRLLPLYHGLLPLSLHMPFPNPRSLWELLITSLMLQILFQIGNLLRAKCNTTFVPQSTVRFQCRSGFWASNFDLGSLLVEHLPGHHLGGGLQGIPHQLPNPGQGPSGSPSGLPPGPSQPHLTPHNTLVQLQLQVEKLAQQPHWQPQPLPPPWSWYQSVRFQRPPQGGSPSQTLPPTSQPSRRITAPTPHHLSPPGGLPSPGFTPQTLQPLRGTVNSPSYQPKHTEALQPGPLYCHSAPLYSHSAPLYSHSAPLYSHSAPLPSNGSLGSPHSGIQIIRPHFPQSLPSSHPHRNAHGQDSLGISAVSQEEKPGTISWRPPEMQASGAQVSAAKRRRRASPGPIIVIKDEPEEDMGHVGRPTERI